MGLESQQRPPGPWNLPEKEWDELRAFGEKLVFHIGYPRTGTTFLQRGIFPKYKDFANTELDLTGFFVDDDQHKMGYGPLLSKMKSYFGHRGWSDRPTICSWENLSGDVLVDFYHVPGRIHEIFPDCKIAVCIRSQYTMIPSLYHIYIKSGGTMNYEGYLNTLIQNDKLNYHALIRKYWRLFGRDSVHVMFFEELKANRSRFLRDLLEFMGLPADNEPWKGVGGKNRRDSLFVTKAYRTLNRIMEKKGVQSVSRALLGECDARARVAKSVRLLFFALNKLDQKLRLFASDSLEKDVNYRDEIRLRYGSSNRVLFEELGLTGNVFGYPLGSEMNEGDVH